NRSIAYGIAKACQREGAELAFTYQGEGIRERVVELAGEFGTERVFACDVADDAQIDTLFADLRKHWDGLEGLVHAIAFAPREALKGAFHESVTREAFRMSHDISSYSLAALAKAAAPMMAGRRGAILTLTYLGATRSMPNYNVMGLAKASLEACVRYLAASLGPKGTRVNAISAGPIKTLAAAGISGFSKILHFVEKNAPLRRGVTSEEVGNTSAFLLSELASGITGEVVYVDAGFNTTTPGMEE
ncbi:MAG: SDR family oxidoreductase, partial [Usitatibacter sp.]